MNNFATFCRLTDKDFFDSRKILYDVADEMEDFYLSSEKVMNISMPTRFGKSRLATAFSVWLLLAYKGKRILRASYSAELSEMFGEQVKVSYLDFYEKLQKRGISVQAPVISGNRSRWKIDNMVEPSHIASGINGSITGFGADVAIVDDTVKNLLEATSAAINTQLNIFKDTVLIGRLENERKIINVGTRWTTNDWFTKFKPDREVVIEAMDEYGQSVCEAWKTTEELQKERNEMPPDIFAAQYMQHPTATGRYRMFEDYRIEIKEVSEAAKRYIIIDPATSFGKDYFVVGYYGVERGCIYLIDMYAKQAAMIEDVYLYICGKDYEIAYCEANGVGRSIIELLRKKGIKNIVGFSTKTDKYSRAYLQNENIKNYLYLCRRNENVDLLQNQFYEFPNGEHDDLVDNVIMAFEKLLKK